MHAIRQHAFGPPETLRFEEVPDPVPAAEQVRIAVEAAGLHLIGTGRTAVAATEITTRDLMARGLTVSWAIPRALGRTGGQRQLETRALVEAAAGRLVPLVGRAFPLAEAAAAHSALETRATEGKTVLVP